MAGFKNQVIPDDCDLDALDNDEIEELVSLLTLCPFFFYVNEFYLGTRPHNRSMSSSDLQPRLRIIH